MSATSEEIKLNSRAIAELLRPYRSSDNHTNFKWLALEYCSLALVLGSTLGFYLYRESWGLNWYWNVPVSVLAIILVGGLQHRLSGLAHEASHFCLFRHRLLNELMSDLFCMFPIFATTHQYRLVHMAHHQYVNDWERDPDLTNIGESKLMDRFPMTRGQFIYNFFLRFLYPPALLRYFWDVLYLSVLGRGRSPYVDEVAFKQPSIFGIRVVSLMGITYLLGLVVLFHWLNRIGINTSWLIRIGLAVGFTACVVTRLLPEKMFFQSPVKSVYSSRTAAVMRMGYYSLALLGFAVARSVTGINFGVYFLLLWVLPLLTTFSYFMLLRDVYQHANADTGRLTNSRVFHSDPFTWWSVFVYGQGLHLPHHLFPAIPHYNLREVHELLKSRCPEYAESVVECEGTFFNRSGRPTVLDVVTPQETKRQPAKARHLTPVGSFARHLN